MIPHLTAENFRITMFERVEQVPVCHAARDLPFNTVVSVGVFGKIGVYMTKNRLQHFLESQVRIDGAECYYEMLNASDLLFVMTTDGTIHDKDDKGLSRKQQPILIVQGQK